jgi:hypothetical protein
MHSEKAGNSRDPITVTVKEACELSGFGPTSIWKFIKDGRLKARRVPGVDRTLVVYSSLRELLTPDPPCARRSETCHRRYAYFCRNARLNCITIGPTR